MYRIILGELFPNLLLNDGLHHVDMFYEWIEGTRLTLIHLWGGDLAQGYGFKEIDGRYP